MEALPFIDDRFRNSEEVNQIFLSILREGKRVETLLRKMHELGFLSRYIPEFSEVEGKVHYDLYHVHPVDIHSLLAVGELVKLSDGLYQKDYPLLTSLVREIKKPEILFLTTLLHDIGKGMEGNHSLVGAEIGRRIGSRMRLSVEDKELIGFLVSHHLLMVETALRRDLHDEQVILRFANEVKNLNQLKMLYLLTFADIKAVGPDAWTSWKNTLLMELFLKTSHSFEKGAVAAPFFKGNEAIQKLQEFLSPEIISEYADQLPDRYLSCYSSEEIAHHIEMARFIEEGTSSCGMGDGKGDPGKGDRMYKRSLWTFFQNYRFDVFEPSEYPRSTNSHLGKWHCSGYILGGRCYKRDRTASSRI